LLGAGLFGVEAALRLGLIDAVRRDAEEAAHAWLERTAGYPRRVYAHEKSLLVGGVARPERAELARFHEVEIPFWSSEELRARVLAVLTR
jgi:enoyl-CoA hydratase/carnithine racemase